MSNACTQCHARLSFVDGRELNANFAQELVKFIDCSHSIFASAPGKNSSSFNIGRNGHDARSIRCQPFCNLLRSWLAKNHRDHG